MICHLGVVGDASLDVAQALSTISQLFRCLYESVEQVHLEFPRLWEDWDKAQVLDQQSSEPKPFQFLLLA